MTIETNVAGFEPLYGDAELAEELIPWDIGGPQPVVEQLVAHGAIRGEVLDPGTGPGYHAIQYALQGFSATGIDGSPSAIERAKRNAERAGVHVDFQVADATRLDGFEGRFDTVVDSAFYHVFLGDEATQTRYAQALHRATKPGARLYMFEFSPHNVNGIQWAGIPADNFDRVLGASGWRVDYLGGTTYQARVLPRTFAAMTEVTSQIQDDMLERIQPLMQQLSVLGPLLEEHRVHIPVWAVVATRLD
ncbi:SAM-dependent methyltransferase [Mycobacterium kansasii]|uniref:Glycine/sarcosine N-methyltransferase n=1 Tax=Mycobacterium attenuatum TaxID=2341086 RepID=A0A498PS82_9MYCO|nr:class I SAM-dependent methyltransferase [Mycobacterium attenuatum]ORB85387.1 SAM-dependent methyltransferase [Mycobacterium kansasii]VBA34407.1 Glycine/sarcosine N-methyltransferase [Mycobacterium attenuatum]VBA46793.1 Glycine/sarcosine N-methyltransferase [Mycobacterium attenuatum]VBA51046.1 Glycine/sarcosine N-methyltransferase [Mycobacterium attenuatum]